ncbi:MAG: hypothetical protein ACFFD4_26360 [Candidatus Odinarchaeota archaeon]
MIDIELEISCTWCRIKADNPVLDKIKLFLLALIIGDCRSELKQVVKNLLKDIETSKVQPILNLNNSKGGGPAPHIRQIDTAGLPITS